MYVDMYVRMLMLVCVWKIYFKFPHKEDFELNKFLYKCIFMCLSV